MERINGSLVQTNLKPRKASSIRFQGLRIITGSLLYHRNPWWPLLASASVALPSESFFISSHLSTFPSKLWQCFCWYKFLKNLVGLLDNTRSSPPHTRRSPHIFFRLPHQSHLCWLLLRLVDWIHKSDI